MKASIGIDLGTSNCAVAITIVDEDLSKSTLDNACEPKVIKLRQVVASDRIEGKDLLPSAIYIPPQAELDGSDYSSLRTSVNTNNHNVNPDSYIVGSYAREKGSLVPDRLVVSAKSWLCNNRVDRELPILPWKSKVAQDKHLSPVSATSLLLSHVLREVDDYLEQNKISHGVNTDQCEVVITIPASFDDIARRLTLKAIENAGFSNVTLFEEPQAAFYDWVESTKGSWREMLNSGDLILVCDVGGGTADFTLIAAVEKQDGTLGLERVNVGEHILLGGDNMDLALAIALQSEAKEAGKPDLDAWQFQSLVEFAKRGKEYLFSNESVETFKITIPTRGADLFADPIELELTQGLLSRVILDGFFPKITIDEDFFNGKKQRRVGLRSSGLNYASDPALTRHLANFLYRSRSRITEDPELSSKIDVSNSEIVRPKAVLFNGGVFKSDVIRGKILSVINSITEDEVKILEGEDRSIAVARGASIVGFNKITGNEFKITAGTSNSYYIGIETTGLAVPGIVPELNGVCIVPMGTEEGGVVNLTDSEFDLVVGEEVEFKLFTSKDRPADTVGTVVEDVAQELEEGAVVTVNIAESSDLKTDDIVPVTLQAIVTDVGVIELYMKQVGIDSIWKLEFNTRVIE